MKEYGKGLEKDEKAACTMYEKTAGKKTLMASSVWGSAI